MRINTKEQSTMSTETIENAPQTLIAPEGYKLNLGCGQHHVDGWINVDQSGNPDVTCDLEQFPWPWETESVGEIRLHHVLEHLGESSDIFLKVMQEIYRVCKPGALVHITVPHPRSDHFINDPTHVRALTVSSLSLFSKRFVNHCKEIKAPNTPLADYLEVDLDIVQVNYVFEDFWFQKAQRQEISQEELWQAAAQYNNVISQFTVVMQAVKPYQP